jgi:regulator of sigma E protease
MLDKILIFILFLGPLIFFHELGHFLFARLFGVRVEVFSIGFGPKLLKWKWGDTEYTVSLIPLGGYVKMFGDDPLNKVELSEAEKKLAFNHKSKWARFWIVFGGPFANFLLAYVLYAGLLFHGEKVPEPKFGLIKNDSIYYQMGIRTGDILSEINNRKIYSFDDLDFTASQITEIKTIRNNEEIAFTANLEYEQFIKDFSTLQSQLRLPIVVDKEFNYYLISDSSDSLQVKKSIALEELDNLKLNTIHLYKINNFDLAKYNSTDIELTYQKSVSLNSQKILTVLGKENYFALDLIVDEVIDKSPAKSALIKKGDIIYSINGTHIDGFESLKVLLQNKTLNGSVKIGVISSGQTKELLVEPQIHEINGQQLYAIGVKSIGGFIPFEMTQIPSKGFFGSFYYAIERTWDGIEKTVVGFKKLILGEVSLNNIGGPLAIGKVASDSFYISLSMFFRLMALISINLGIINLFPIPVLDGGHIVFLIFEFFNGGPLSQKKLQIAQQLGMSFLLLLIGFSLFNDLSRFF